MEVRRALEVWWKALFSDGESLGDLLTRQNAITGGYSGDHKNNKFFKDVILHAYIWEIWRHRSRVTFNEDKSFSPLLIANNVQSDAFLWVNNRSSNGRNLNWVDWCCNLIAL